MCAFVVEAEVGSVALSLKSVTKLRSPNAVGKARARLTRLRYNRRLAILNEFHALKNNKKDLDK